MRAAQAATASHQEPEHELWQGGYSSKAMIGGWIAAGILTLVALAAAVLVPPAGWIAAAALIPLAWLVPAIRLLWLRLGHHYTLTTQRFLHREGVVSQVNDQILLVDVDDITFAQTLLGRMLGFGIITIRAKDLSIESQNRSKKSSPDALELVPVDDVQRVANLIDEARREERRKRALYMATV